MGSDGVKCPLCNGLDTDRIGQPQTSIKARQYIDKQHYVFMCKACRFYFVALISFYIVYN